MSGPGRMIRLGTAIVVLAWVAAAAFFVWAMWEIGRLVGLIG